VVDSDTAVVTFKFACLPDRGHCTMSHPSAAVAPHCIEPCDGSVGVIHMISHFFLPDWRINMYSWWNEAGGVVI